MILLRGFVVLLSLVFSFSQMAGGAPALRVEERDGNFLGIQIPRDLATVQEIEPPTPEPEMPWVLHIQNAHGNYEAQLKIRELLRLLHDQYGFKTFFVEGASGKLDPKLLRLFPDRDRNLAFADALTKQGELTGVEYYLMEAPDDVEALGIEKPELYRANLEAFQAVETRKKEAQAFLQDFSQAWDRVASKELPEEAWRLVSEWKKFNKGSRDFFPAVKRLGEETRKYPGLDLNQVSAQREWPQLTRVLVLNTIESQLDFEAFKREREKLVKFLKGFNVSPPLIEALQAEEPPAPRQLFERLAQETRTQGFLFRDYPAFSRWAGWWTLRSELDSQALFDEVDRLFVILLDKLAASDRQKELLELDRDVELLRKFFSLELRREDWTRVFLRRELLEPAALWKRLSEPKTLSLSNASEIFEAAFQFYQRAEERENAFIEIMGQEMAARGEKKSVLLTGGFHREGVTQKFRAKGIAYAVLSPRFSKGEENASGYRKAMVEKTPTAFDLASVEEPAKMIPRETLEAYGRSREKEAEVILNQFIEIMQRESGLEELTRLWKIFADSSYAKNRGVAVEEVSEKDKWTARVSLPEAKFDVTFYPTGAGLATQMKRLSPRVSSEKISKIRMFLPPPEAPRSAAPVPSRAETRASVPYRHEPVDWDLEGDHLNEPNEVVSLGPLRLKKWLAEMSPFHARAIQAFLWADFKTEPQLQSYFLGLPTQARSVFLPFQGALTGLEMKTFLRTFYEIQEKVKKETGRFDKGVIREEILKAYEARIPGYDNRELNPQTEKWIKKERLLWKSIFEDLVDRILAPRNRNTPFERLAVSPFRGKEYTQVVPGGTLPFAFHPGKFPKEGVSVILGEGQNEIKVVFIPGTFRNQWLIRYEQDPTQNVTFDQAGGHVVVGSAPVPYVMPEPYVRESHRIVIPAADDIAPRHAIVSAMVEKGRPQVSVTDGWVDVYDVREVTKKGKPVERGRRDRNPSGKIILMEYPSLEDVEIPLLRSEARERAAIFPLLAPQEEAGAVQAPQRETSRVMTFSPPDFSKLDELPAPLAVSALAHGIMDTNLPDKEAALEDFARLIRPTEIPEALQALGKTYPRVSVSESPGALVFITPKTPTRAELVAIRLLLLTQKKQFFRLVFPAGAVSEEEMARVEERARKIFEPTKAVMGKRFEILRVKEREELIEIPRRIYDAMKSEGMALKNVQDLETNYFVQWVDESVSKYLDLEAAAIPYAKIMKSRLAGEELYSQLVVWGAAGAMKISQGARVQDVDEMTQALSQNGRFIQFRVTEALRGLVAGFMRALQASLRFAQAA